MEVLRPLNLEIGPQRDFIGHAMVRTKEDQRLDSILLGSVILVLDWGRRHHSGLTDRATGTRADLPQSLFRQIPWLGNGIVNHILQFRSIAQRKERLGNLRLKIVLLDKILMRRIQDGRKARMSFGNAAVLIEACKILGIQRFATQCQDQTRNGGIVYCFRQ